MAQATNEEDHAPMGLLDTNILRIALNAALNLLAAIGLGVWLARRNGRNLLGPEAVRALSKLIYWLFQPSLVFCSVSKTLFHAVSNSGGISTIVLATMPMAAMMHIGFGYVTAQALIKLLCIRPGSDERDVLVCCTFGNAAPLPLVFASSLFSSRPDLHADVIACISFYLMAWSPCFYTLAPLMMDANEDEAKAEYEPWIHPRDKRKDEDVDDNAASSKKQLNLSAVLTPPVLGSVAGVAVGLVPALSNWFLSSDGWAAPLYSAIHTFSSAYLPSVLLVLAGSLVATQSCPVDPMPTASLTLGPSQKRSHASSQASSNSKLGQAPLEMKSLAGRRRKDVPNASLRPIFCICLTRFFLMPALTFIALHTIQSLVFDDEMNRRSRTVCSFVVLLESCMPSAQNSVVLLQMKSMTDRARRMSRLLTVLYIIALLPITILLNLTLASTGILRLS